LFSTVRKTVFILLPVPQESTLISCCYYCCTNSLFAHFVCFPLLHSHTIWGPFWVFLWVILLPLYRFFYYWLIAWLLTILLLRLLLKRNLYLLFIINTANKQFPTWFLTCGAWIWFKISLLTIGSNLARLGFEKSQKLSNSSVTNNSIFL